MKIKKLYIVPVLLAGLLLAAVFTPSQAHAQTLSETATESWASSDCSGSVNGAQTSYYGVASGDSVNLEVTNSSTEILNITISGSGYNGTVNGLGPGQSYSNTYTATNYLEVYATAPSCNGKVNDSSLIIEGASGSLACSSSDGGKVWNVTGQYSNVMPSIDMYRGSTYVADVPTSFANNTSSSVAVNEQFSAMSSATTYYLYNGTSSARLIGQATCPAYVAATTSSTPPANTTSKTSTNTTATTTTPATATSSTTPSSTDSVKAATPVVVSSSKNINARNTSAFHKLVKNHALLAAFIAVWFIIWLVSLIGMWKAFNKAGKHGWAAIIPIYSSWVMYEIGDKPGWWALVSLVPFVSIIAIVMLLLADLEIAKKFGKGPIFAVLWLFIFGFVGWSIIGYGKASLNKSEPVASDFIPQAPVS